VPDRRVLILEPQDNVANALEEVLPGDSIHVNMGGETVILHAEEHIPFGFKVAVKDIPVGEPVIKYGRRIGIASRPIRRGTLVHIHNLAGTRGRGDLKRGT